MCADVLFWYLYWYNVNVFLCVYIYIYITLLFRYLNMWMYLFMPQEFSPFKVVPLLAHYCFDRQYIAKQRRMVERLRYWCRICLLAEDGGMSPHSSIFNVSGQSSCWSCASPSNHGSVKQFVGMRKRNNPIYRPLHLSYKYGWVVVI